MAVTKTDSTITSDKSLAGILSLLVAGREERLDDGEPPRKTEVVLARAGLTAAEIASLMGKNIDGVRKAIQRGRR